MAQEPPPIHQSLKEQLAREYAGAVQRKFGPRQVSIILFGSVARQEAGPTSDIDLLLILEDLPPGRFARKALLDDIEALFWPKLMALEAKGTSCQFAPLLYTPSEAVRFRPIYLDMVQDAVLLYDRDDFFQHVLKRLGQRMNELGSVRRRLGRYRYWDLKPDLTPGERFEL